MNYCVTADDVPRDVVETWYLLFFCSCLFLPRPSNPLISRPEENDFVVVRIRLVMAACVYRGDAAAAAADTSARRRIAAREIHGFFFHHNIPRRFYYYFLSLSLSVFNASSILFVGERVLHRTRPTFFSSRASGLTSIGHRFSFYSIRFVYGMPARKLFVSMARIRTRYNGILLHRSNTIYRSYRRTGVFWKRRVVKKRNVLRVPDMRFFPTFTTLIRRNQSRAQKKKKKENQNVIRNST